MDFYYSPSLRSPPPTPPSSSYYFSTWPRSIGWRRVACRSPKAERVYLRRRLLAAAVRHARARVCSRRRPLSWEAGDGTARRQWRLSVRRPSVWPWGIARLSAPRSPRSLHDGATQVVCLSYEMVDGIVGLSSASISD